MDSSLTPIFQIFKEELEALEKESESEVLDLTDRYKGLALQALYTSFSDLENIMGHKAIKGKWIDIGGGSGRSCLLYSFLKNEESINIEIDPARSRITDILAAKFKLKASSLTSDLLKEEIPEGDCYFLYFPTGIVLDRVLDELSKRQGFNLVVIESHGDLIARIEKEHGYELVAQIPLETPRHHPYAHIYQKKEKSPLQLGPHQLSFMDHLLVIKDDAGEWIANSYGLEWLTGDQYQFLYPPRTISWNQSFKGIFDKGSKDFGLIWHICEVRKLGELKFVLKNGEELYGCIRKIRLSTPLLLEISTSELIEWESIEKIFKGSHLCYEFSSSSFSLPAP